MFLWVGPELRNEVKIVFLGGLVDEAADEEEISFVSLHYFGKFETVDGLLVYNGGLMITFPFNRKSLKFELLLSYAEDMYHVERGHCRGDYSYKMHWLVPGKKLSEGLQFIFDDSSVEKMGNATPIGSCAKIYVEEVQLCEEAVKQLQNRVDDVPVVDDVRVVVSETYSKHKGSRFALVNVDAV